MHYEEVSYEGLRAPRCGRLRRGADRQPQPDRPEIRTIFSKLGGSIAEPGAVAWQFERKGVIHVPASVAEDDVMLVALDAGAEDIRAEGDTWTVVSEAAEHRCVRHAPRGAGIEVASSDLTMLPTSLVELDSAEAVKPILRLIDALDEHDDVQDVYANFDIPESVLAELDA